MMSPSEVVVVQQSWKKLLPISNQVAGMFYRRLFELDPSLRRLFQKNLQVQGREFIPAFSKSLDVLPDHEQLHELLEDLSARYEQFEVLEERFDLFEKALLWTLRQGLGEEFTPEVSSAWHSAFETFAGAVETTVTTAAC